MAYETKVEEDFRCRGKSHEEGGRDWSHAKECLKTSISGRGKERISHKAFRGNVTLLKPWFQTSGCHAVKEYISIVVSHPVCGNFLIVALGN